MTKKYPLTRMPIEAKQNWERKIKEIEKTLHEEGKNVKIHFTDGLRFFSQKPMFVYNDELIKFFVKNKRRNNGK